MEHIAIRNAHTLLRAAFFDLYCQSVGYKNAQTSHASAYVYALSDGEAVDWLHQLLNGDVVLDLHYDFRLNRFSPALGVA